MWIKTSENTPNIGDVVLVRFDKQWCEDECDYWYEYAVAHYDGKNFSPDGVEATSENSGVQFFDNEIPTEWKEI